MTGFYSLLYANSKYKHKKPNFFYEIQAFKHLKKQTIYKKKHLAKMLFTRGWKEIQPVILQCGNNDLTYIMLPTFDNDSSLFNLILSR